MAGNRRCASSNLYKQAIEVGTVKLFVQAGVKRDESKNGCRRIVAGFS